MSATKTDSSFTKSSNFVTLNQTYATCCFKMTPRGYCLSMRDYHFSDCYCLHNNIKKGRSRYYESGLFLIQRISRYNESSPLSRKLLHSLHTHFLLSRSNNGLGHRNRSADRGGVRDMIIQSRPTDAIRILRSSVAG